MSRFTIRDIEVAEKGIDLVFRNTPQYEYGPLSEALGSKVVVKIETQNPIRSFKGRGADLLAAGAAEPLVCASAGNFGQAMAYACTKRKLPLTIFASTKANPLKVERMRALGGNVILEGDDFDEAKENARVHARQTGQRFVEDSRDVETAIGAGTIALELMRLTNPLDAVLVPVGNGALINGIGRAFKDAKSPTEIIGIQSAGAPAMLESWSQKKIIRYPSIHTIADGIGVRLPVIEALQDMADVVDKGMLVQESSILAAMKLLFSLGGILAEPSAVVGIASLMENSERFKNKRVGVIICGSNLTQEQIKNWIL
jgi:threonine dehydratase